MRICIVKTSSAGDIVQALPVATSLLRKYPGATIDWVVERRYVALVAAHPDVMQAIPIDSYRWRSELLSSPYTIFQEMRRHLGALRQERYDLLFDLQGNTKSALLTWLIRAKEKVGFGATSVAEFPALFTATRTIDVPGHLPMQLRYHALIEEGYLPTTLSLTLAEGEIPPPASSPRIMVAPFSKWPNKEPSLEALAEFLSILFVEVGGTYLFVAGSDSERSRAEQLATSFPTAQVLYAPSFPLWQAAMRQMDLVIAADSVALHLAGMTETPTLGLFGPSKAEVYNPLGAGRLSVQGACPYGEEFPARCPRLRSCPTGACLKGLSGRELWQRCGESLLSSLRKSRRPTPAPRLPQG